MTRVEVVAILGSLGLLAFIVELVRRRQLAEAYSLLWLMTGFSLLVLSLWRGLLDVLSALVGIFYPPAALFVVGFGFVLLILLQFSAVISRLAAENKQLAEQVGILKWKLEREGIGASSGLYAKTEGPRGRFLQHDKARDDADQEDAERGEQ